MSKIKMTYQNSKNKSIKIFGFWFVLLIFAF